MTRASPLAQAQAAFRNGDLRTAGYLAQQEIDRTGGTSEAFLLLARIFAESGDHAQAQRLAELGLKLNPSDADCLAQRAFARLRMGEREGARADAAGVLDCPSAPAEALDLACAVFHALGGYSQAAEAQTRAVALEPGNPGVLTNLGSVLVICGDIQRAIEAYREAIRLDPANARALAALSEVRKATSADNNLPLIRDAVMRCGDAHTRLVLHHALAREQEMMGDFAGAMTALKIGKEGMAAAVGADPLRDRELFQSLHRTYARKPATCGTSGRQAIFVVGMPRSGTTVMERILSALPGVASIGESPLLPAILRQAVGSQSPAIADAGALEQGWDRLDAAAIAAAYLHHAGQAAHGSPFWIDKLPLNMLLAGVIVRVMPDARILWVHRGAMDTALGNYRQMFEYRSSSYDYTLSLSATAEYVADAEELRRGLQLAFPQQIFSVRLEDLISDPEANARKITDFCQLPWDASCLRIERNASPVGSASAVAVREPINSSYVGRWKQYGAFMEAAGAVFLNRGIPLEH